MTRDLRRLQASQSSSTARPALSARDTAEQSTVIRCARELSRTSMPSARASRAVANVSSPVTTMRPSLGSLIPTRTF
jgi:hypothetical protein